MKIYGFYAAAILLGLAVPAEAVTVTFAGKMAGNDGLTGLPYEFVFSTENSFAIMSVDNVSYTIAGPVDYGNYFNPGPVYHNENYSTVSIGMHTDTANISIFAFKYGPYGSPPPYPELFENLGAHPLDWLTSIYFTASDGSQIRLLPAAGSVSVAAVPLPPALLLLLSALAGLWWIGGARAATPQESANSESIAKDYKQWQAEALEDERYRLATERDTAFSSSPVFAAPTKDFLEGNGTLDQ